MSFLLSLLLLLQFLEHWASCYFPCAGFSSRSVSTTEAFAELGFSCTWLLPHGGWAEVVSTRLIQVTAPYMSGEFVISSVLSRCSKNVKQWTDHCYSSVLQLSFIWQAKENTSLRRKGWPTQKVQREDRGPILAPLFICFFSPYWACPM